MPLFGRRIASCGRGSIVAPKTPHNSGTPPSQGRKGSGEAARPVEGQAACRGASPAHPNPTQRHEVFAGRCPHCRTDVSGLAQAPVQECKPMTASRFPRSSPTSPASRLTAGSARAAPEGSRPRRRRGWNRARPSGRTCALLPSTLRFTHAIPFERLARLMSDLLGLTISEGALVNMLAESHAR